MKRPPSSGAFLRASLNCFTSVSADFARSDDTFLMEDLRELELSDLPPSENLAELGRLLPPFAA